MQLDTHQLVIILKAFKMDFLVAILPFLVKIQKVLTVPVLKLFDQLFPIYLFLQTYV